MPKYECFYIGYSNIGVALHRASPAPLFIPAPRSLPFLSSLRLPARVKRWSREAPTKL